MLQRAFQHLRQSDRQQVLVLSLAWGLIAVGCGGGRVASAPASAPPPAPRPESVQPGEPPEVEPGSAPTVPTPVARLPGAFKAPASPLKGPPPLGDDLLLGFEARSFRSPGGLRLRYRLFRPPGYDPQKKYPLIVFLHGASGSGTDNRKQLTGSRRYGVELWASAEVQAEHPAFILAPQADPALSPTWVRYWRAAADPDPMRAEPLEMVVDLIAELQHEFSLDPDRFYLTGMSMGGFGAWIGISRYPGLFAAATPMCGGGDPSHVGETEAAVWAFHGKLDRVVPVRRSREMVDALRKAGKNPRYNEYPKVGHEVWKRAFEEPELVEWLFKQRR